MIKVLTFILFAILITSSDAIHCDFVYKQSDVVNVDNSNIVFPEEQKSPTPQQNGKPFECDFDPSLDDFIEVNITQINTRGEVDDEDYVEVEKPCHSVKRWIAPKELKNVYNKLTKIAVIQKLLIEECVDPSSCCSRKPVPPNKKVLCKQQHLTIMLMAVDDNNKKYEESFYYPSSCSCVTLMKKSDIL